MTEFATYNDAVVHTLRSRAIRSAILIDDSFPSYRDLLGNDDADLKVRLNYPDWEKARDLHGFLHKNKIICDIENRISDINDEFIEKIHKSDLIVLDWNLRSGDDLSSEDAVRILKGLASSKHFNMVVVYTNTKDLKAAWTRAVVHLRAGWRRKEDMLKDLEKNIDIDELFDALDGDNATELVTESMLARYVLNGWDGLHRQEKENLTKLMQGKGVAPRNSGKFAEALIHRVAITAHHVDNTPDSARQVEGDPDNKFPYFVCGSVFVAFMRKSNEASLFECLDGALTAWRPNLLQLLVSELQNELERNSHAFDRAFFPSDALKAGWLYHTLQAYANGGGRVEALDGVVADLNGRIVEALVSAVTARMEDASSDLLTFGRQAARLALDGVDHTQPEAKLVESAKVLARVERVDNLRVLHALNEYLSADAFRGGHITTGTVLCTEDASRWFLCVSPACDMVPRPPKDEISWHKDLYPLRPMNLLRLEPCNPGSALAEAERSVTVFVSHEGKEKYLRAVDGTTRSPRPMTCFLAEDGAAASDSSPDHPRKFNVLKVTHANGETKLVAHNLIAVAQLRPAYAARFLHLTGAHQSRVGVDFVEFGKKEEAKKCTKTGREGTPDPGEAGGDPQPMPVNEIG